MIDLCAEDTRLNSRMTRAIMSAFYCVITQKDSVLTMKKLNRSDKNIRLRGRRSKSFAPISMQRRMVITRHCRLFSQSGIDITIYWTGRCGASRSSLTTSSLRRRRTTSPIPPQRQLLRRPRWRRRRRRATTTTTTSAPAVPSGNAHVAGRFVRRRRRRRRR